jgi:hypothetical protein
MNFVIYLFGSVVSGLHISQPKGGPFSLSLESV